MPTKTVLTEIRCRLATGEYLGGEDTMYLDRLIKQLSKDKLLPIGAEAMVLIDNDAYNPSAFTWEYIYEDIYV